MASDAEANGLLALLAAAGGVDYEALEEEAQLGNVHAPGDVHALNPSQASRSATASRPFRLVEGGPCTCCGARLSPQWRRPPVLEKLLIQKPDMFGGQVPILCNACGIFLNRHKVLPERKGLGNRYDRPPGYDHGLEAQQRAPGVDADSTATHVGVDTMSAAPLPVLPVPTGPASAGTKASSLVAAATNFVRGAAHSSPGSMVEQPPPKPAVRPQRERKPPPFRQDTPGTFTPHQDRASPSHSDDSSLSLTPKSSIGVKRPHSRPLADLLGSKRSYTGEHSGAQASQQAPAATQPRVVTGVSAALGGRFDWPAPPAHPGEASGPGPQPAHLQTRQSSSAVQPGNTHVAPPGRLSGPVAAPAVLTAAQPASYSQALPSVFSTQWTEQTGGAGGYVIHSAAPAPPPPAPRPQATAPAPSARRVSGDVPQSQRTEPTYAHTPPAASPAGPPAAQPMMIMPPPHTMQVHTAPVTYLVMPGMMQGPVQVMHYAHAPQAGGYMRAVPAAPTPLYYAPMASHHPMPQPPGVMGGAHVATALHPAHSLPSSSQQPVMSQPVTYVPWPHTAHHAGMLHHAAPSSHVLHPPLRAQPTAPHGTAPQHS